MFGGRAVFVLYKVTKMKPRGNTIDEGGAASSEQHALLCISFRAPVISQSMLADTDDLQEMVISITAFKCELSLQPNSHWKAKAGSYFQDTSHLSFQNRSWWMTLVMAMAIATIDSAGGKELSLIVSCVVVNMWECHSLAHKSAAAVPVFGSTPCHQSNFLFSARNKL